MPKGKTPPRPEGQRLEVGIGLDVGPASVGIIGEGEISDFTAIADVINTAARVQGAAFGGEIVMSQTVADMADVTQGEEVKLELKGKAEPVAARRITVGA
jgi:adenylate cyclase